MGQALEFIAHLFLPNRCPFCGVPIGAYELLCGKCREDPPAIPADLCLFCGARLAPGAACPCRESQGYGRLVAPFYYERGADRAVLDLKFHGNFENARKLAIFLDRSLREAGFSKEQLDAIVPVPLTARDQRSRGFNQCAQLGKQLSGLLDVPLRCDLLKKVRQTPKQHRLSEAERRENLSNAYRASPAAAGRRLLLLDDVCTTGTTLAECAHVLRNAGAAGVLAAVCTRTR